MGFWSWVDEKVSDVGDAVEHGFDSVVEEFGELGDEISQKGLLSGTFDYGYNNGVELVEGVGQLGEDALEWTSNNGKGALKFAATGVGFIPVIGDAAEIVLQGAATGVGIMTNPGNWKAELAEGSLEIAIAAIPGPAGAVYKGAKMATKAATGFAKEAAETTIKTATKEAMQIATKAVGDKAGDVTKYVAENTGKSLLKGVSRTAEQVAMPGVGQFVAPALVRGVTHKAVPVAMLKDAVANSPVTRLLSRKASKEFAENGASNLTEKASKEAGEALAKKLGIKTSKSLSEMAPDAAKGLAKNVDEADNLLLKAMKGSENVYEKVTGRFGKATLLSETLWDELVWENLVLEQVGNTWSRYTANMLSEDGELVQTMMGDEYRQVMNDPREVLAHHGIDVDPNIKLENLQFQDIKSYMKDIEKDLVKSLDTYHEGRSKLFLESAGLVYDELPEEIKIKTMQDHFQKRASDLIDTQMNKGVETKKGETAKVFAWDHEKQVPVTADNVDEYLNLISLKTEDALKLSEEHKKDASKGKQDTSATTKESEVDALLSYTSELEGTDSNSKEQDYINPLQVANNNASIGKGNTEINI